MVEDTGGIDDHLEDVDVDGIDPMVEDSKSESKGGGGALSQFTLRGRIIYWAEKYAEKLYGIRSDHPDKGRYDLVDCWLMVPFFLEKKFDSRTRRRATLPGGWNKRLNRHLMPNKYYVSKLGVDRFFKNYKDKPGEIRWLHKWRYRLLVKFPPFLVPPLGYFSKSHREDAEKWAKAEMGGGMTEERTREIVREEHERGPSGAVNMLKGEIEDRIEMYDRIEAKMEEARKDGRVEEAQEWKKELDSVKRELRRKRLDLRRLKEGG